MKKLISGVVVIVGGCAMLNLLVLLGGAFMPAFVGFAILSGMFVLAIIFVAGVVQAIMIAGNHVSRK